MAELSDDSLMPFGRFKGQKMKDVPAWYLLHIYHEGLQSGNVRDYIEDCRDALEIDIKKESRQV